MNRLELLLTKHNVDLRNRWMANDVALTRTYTDSVVLTYCKKLSRPEALVGVTMMLGVLEMEWEGTQFRFRFPLPDEDPVLQVKSRRTKRDYRKALRWAANYLITDRMLEELQREGLEPWVLCEQEGLTPELVAARLGVILPDDVLEFQARGIAPFFCLTM